jgi:hypothetical protein
MDDILKMIMSNPVSMGIIMNIISKMLHNGLTAVDKSGAETSNMPTLNTLYLILTFLLAAVTAAMKGQLGTLDLTALLNLIQTWLPILIAGKALEPVIQHKPLPPVTQSGHKQ